LKDLFGVKGIGENLNDWSRKKERRKNPVKKLPKKKVMIIGKVPDEILGLFNPTVKNDIKAFS